MPLIRSARDTGVAMMTATAAFIVASIAPLVAGDIYVQRFYPRTNQTLLIHEYIDQAAVGWAAEIDENMYGYLVAANPVNACEPITGPPARQLKDRLWFVMTRRGDCNFGDKARNAEHAGFDAVIVSNVGSDDTMKMSGGDVVVGIPVVSMGETAAEDLFEYNHLKNPDCTIIITNENDFSWLERYLWPFFGVITGCFCCLAIYVLVKWMIERRRVRRIASRRRLTEKQLKKIPTKKFKKGDAYEVCAICLEDYEENEKLRILPCNHAYHTKCVDPWLTKSRKSCPVCKRKVLTGKEMARRDAEEREARRRADEEEGERSSEEESTEEEEEEGRGNRQEVQEESPLLQDPPTLTIVDRLRRFFRQRDTIEVPIEEQTPRSSRGSRSSYGSLDRNDAAADDEMAAAERRLQMPVEPPLHLQRSVESSPSAARRRDWREGDSPCGSRGSRGSRAAAPVTTVEATVHVEGGGAVGGAAVGAEGGGDCEAQHESNVEIV